MKNQSNAKTSIPPILKPLLNKYRICNRCLIGSVCKTRIHYRGAARCDILFVGDSASDLDVSTEEPFSGPAGTLLTELIEDAGLDKYKITFTNAVICVTASSLGGKIRKPTSKEIKACSTRLDEFIRVVRPKAIVAVGADASRSLDMIKQPHVTISHPNNIFRLAENGDVEKVRAIHTLKGLHETFKEKKVRGRKSPSKS